ncbi:MAG TPA: ABC transporter ATP-binding protein [Rhizobiaceae bacterium]
MLEVRGLNVFRGATHVLKDLSFDVAAGELAALVGSNGAGKSTTLLTLSGLLRARSGSAALRAGGGSLDLLRASPAAIVRGGVVQCPEGRQIFQSLTVAENLVMGAYTRTDAAEIARITDEVHALFPILAERRSTLAGALSGGEQMMLAMGRALLAAPKLLLLDEPSLGLAPKMVETIFDVIVGLKASGVTILLIEQNAAMALEIADRAYVLEQGRIAIAGTGAELAGNDEVRRVYLGIGA